MSSKTMSKTCGPSYKHANMYMANHNEQPLERKVMVGNLRSLYLTATVANFVNM